MNTHRWSRATTQDPRWGLLCKCGNLKTDQALSCMDCSIKRRWPEKWARRTCPGCGGPKSRQARQCRFCKWEQQRWEPRFGITSAAPDHPWREAA